MSENPTLKVRLEMPENNWGRDCYQVAAELAAKSSAKVLAAKWGRLPSDWRESKDWGRQRLTDRQRGYVEAVAAMTTNGAVERHLLDIIDSLVTTKVPESTTATKENA